MSITGILSSLSVRYHTHGAETKDKGAICDYA